jgi:hypothetical protein
VKVRVRACRGPVVEGNCVAERQGGEQPEVKRQSVGARTCFGGIPWRACSWRAKPGTTTGADTAGKATGGRITWLRSECREGEASGPERPHAGRDGMGGSEPSYYRGRFERWRGTGSKTGPREEPAPDLIRGRQEAGDGATGARQSEFRQCRQGYTRNRRLWRRSPRVVVGGSLDLDGPDGVGAGHSLPLRRRGASEAASGSA